MIKVTATKIDVQYMPQYESEARTKPKEIWECPDGRILAVYEGAESFGRVFSSRRAFAEMHPVRVWSEWAEHTDREYKTFEVSPLPATYEVSVDWAEVHDAAMAIDRARNGYPSLELGVLSFGIGDVLGGTYHHTAWDGLPGLIRLLHATEVIARAAWHVVHKAYRQEDGVERARHACRVAAACSRMYSILERAGIVGDCSCRICGTGEGYGLTGLRWLAREPEDEGCTTEEVDRFIETGELPTSTSTARVSW